MNAREGKRELIKNPVLTNILSALAVAVFGFILLGLTFLFNFLIFQLIDIFIRGNPESMPQWFGILRHIVFVVIIGLISWGIFKTKFRVLFKAIYLPVPVAVVLVTLGILLYPSPFLPYLIGGLLTLGVLYYFFRTRKPWLYYFSLILTALVLLVFTLSGGEI